MPLILTFWAARRRVMPSLDDPAANHLILSRKAWRKPVRWLIAFVALVLAALSARAEQPPVPELARIEAPLAALQEVDVALQQLKEAELAREVARLEVECAEEIVNQINGVLLHPAEYRNEHPDLTLAKIDPTSPPAGAIILHVGDSVATIVNAAPAGATFFFESGVYRGVSITPKHGQTFIGAEGAILNGSAVLTDFTQQGNPWVIGGQTQRGHSREVLMMQRGRDIRRPCSSTIRRLSQWMRSPRVGPGTFYFDYAAEKIYIGDNPTGTRLKLASLQDRHHGNAPNVTVQNLVVEKYDSPTQYGAMGQGGQRLDNSGRRGSPELRRWHHRFRTIARSLDNFVSKIIGNFVHENGQMGLGGGVTISSFRATKSPGTAAGLASILYGKVVGSSSPIPMG